MYIILIQIIRKYNYRLFSMNNFENNLIKSNKSLSLKNSIFENEEFFEWFSGFVDGEGNFLIVINKSKKLIRFRFMIVLHLDDIEVLNYIQNELYGIGTVRKDLKYYRAEYVIWNFNDIYTIIVPLFEKFKLLTIKKYKFNLFAEAVKHKQDILNNWSKGKIFTDLEYQKFVDIKVQMSCNTEIVNNEIDTLINPNWLLGFVEGEGTFGYKYAVPYFQIAQNTKDKHLMDSISNFFSNLIKKNNINGKGFTMSKSLNKKTNVLSYTIQDLIILSNYIIPFFSNMKFKTRKKFDYEMWVIAINIRLKGYNLIKEGKNILDRISKSTNKYRYSNYKSNKIILPTNDEINNLFSLPSVYNAGNNKSYKEQILDYAIKRKRRKGYIVYVYVNGEEINLSPFRSYSLANKELKLNSNIIPRYIDTGKLYKNKYLFLSKKL